MMGKTIMETISGRFNFMSYKVITFILKMPTVNRNFTAPKAGRINRQLDVAVKSHSISPVPFALVSSHSWVAISSKSSVVPPGNGRENLRKLDGEISGRALPIGSRPRILLVNEREARCLMEGELDHPSERRS
jgi:hypothetical protein